MLALLVAASSVQAQQPRPMTPSMTCNQARGLVLARGSVVLGTGTYTYDRYVRDQRFCLRTEMIEPAFVPTRDTPQCPVGYTCREFELDFFGD
ncbi:hypothetical protein [Microvirga splendida]|uniref:hypothetical protein n=1 Tax=Microvirga splendida TaxID=2795727 RepID=UPI0031B9D4A0